MPEGETLTEERDLSGDGGVVTLAPHVRGRDGPQDLSTVAVKYWIRRGAADIGCEEREFVVDDGSEGFAGLDWAVKDLVTSGARRKYRMSKAYLPPTAADVGVLDDEMLDVEVELLKVTAPSDDVQSMTNTGKVEYAERMRAEGNRWFGEGAHARAARRYSSAINAVIINHDYTVEEKRAVQQAGLPCFAHARARAHARAHAACTCHVPHARAHASCTCACHMHMHRWGCSASSTARSARSSCAAGRTRGKTRRWR